MSKEGVIERMNAYVDRQLKSGGAKIVQHPLVVAPDGGCMHCAIRCYKKRGKISERNRVFFGASAADLTERETIIKAMTDVIESQLVTGPDGRCLHCAIGLLKRSGWLSPENEAEFASEQ